MSLQTDVDPQSENVPEGAPNLESKPAMYGNELVEYYLNAGILTPKQIQHAQRVSSKMETSKPLTIIFKDLNFITHDQIIDALQNTPISMPLGKLLVELGHIHQSELQLAIDIQTSENSKRALDKILIDQGLIDEKTLMATRALKLGIPYIEPSFSEIDQTLFSMAPINWYLKHNLIPVRREGQKILVASACPDNKQDLGTHESEAIRLSEVALANLEIFLEDSSIFER